MAAIDFPASPATGQLFSAANGVTYRYDGTLWLVQAGPGGGTGDFMATSASGASIIAASPVTLIFANVMTGNSGGWYNASNGRYTPPAGRYQISAGMAYSAAAASGIWLLPQKNGANIPLGGQTMQAGSTSSSASLQDSANISFVVDANGTDYFTIQCQAQGATLPSVIAWSYFSAFPLTGMQGPMGPPFGGGTGDFCAILTSGGAFPTTASKLIVPTILSGNSGGWYNNTTTGRYTPPAGRYYIAASMTAYCPTMASNMWLSIYKNGVFLQVAVQTTFAANQNAEPHLELVVDANGTDYFEMYIASLQANGTLSNAVFQAFPLTGMQGPAGPGGSLLQSVSFETGAVATGTTQIPLDNTIPQQTEGDQYMTLAITPKSVTSKLTIDVVFVGAIGALNHLGVALFQDAGANAIAAALQTVSSTNYLATVSFRHTMTSGTTSATTFKVRAGPAGGAGTVTFNGQAAAQMFGGVMASSIVIREEAP